MTLKSWRHDFGHRASGTPHRNKCPISFSATSQAEQAQAHTLHTEESALPRADVGQSPQLRRNAANH